MVPSSMPGSWEPPSSVITGTVTLRRKRGCGTGTPSVSREALLSRSYWMRASEAGIAVSPTVPRGSSGGSSPASRARRCAAWTARAAASRRVASARISGTGPVTRRQPMPSSWVGSSSTRRRPSGVRCAGVSCWDSTRASRRERRSWNCSVVMVVGHSEAAASTKSICRAVRWRVRRRIRSNHAAGYSPLCRRTSVRGSCVTAMWASRRTRSATVRVQRRARATVSSSASAASSSCSSLSGSWNDGARAVKRVARRRLSSTAAAWTGRRCGGSSGAAGVGPGEGASWREPSGSRPGPRP